MKKKYSPSFSVRFSGSSLLLAPILALSACGGSGNLIDLRGSDLASRITEPVGCADATARDRFWQSLYNEVNDYGDLPPPSVMSGALAGFSLKNSLLEKAPLELSTAYSDLYSLIHSAAIETPLQSEEVLLHGTTDPSSRRISPTEIPPSQRSALLLKRLAEMELGDRTTPEKEALQNELEGRFQRLAAFNNRADVAALNTALCSAGAPEIDNPNEEKDASADPIEVFEEMRKTMSPSLYGTLKVMSVGYQSCDLLAVDPIDSKTPSVIGITRQGTNSQNGGVLRAVTSATNVMKTNPYYADRTTPSVACFPQTKNPLIYDFGGKPAFTTAKPLELDLFRNSGTGSSALGIDCSGYVSSGMLAAGLRLRANTSGKVAQTHGVSSTMMMNPEKNGLSCLATQSKIDSDSQLLPGDLIAQSGHVVMVDAVGPDPFGIARIQSAAACTSANLPYTRFDFIVTQSSPSKNGIGFNRFKAADYLATNSGMRNGLVQYAIAHCKAKFGTTATVPSAATAKVVRHKGTPECLDRPAERIQIKYAECMNHCAR